jgi:hypothetical protein
MYLTLYNSSLCALYRPTIELHKAKPASAINWYKTFVLQVYFSGDSIIISLLQEDISQMNLHTTLSFVLLYDAGTI